MARFDRFLDPANIPANLVLAETDKKSKTTKTEKAAKPAKASKPGILDILNNLKPVDRSVVSLPTYKPKPNKSNKAWAFLGGIGDMPAHDMLAGKDLVEKVIEIDRAIHGMTVSGFTAKIVGEIPARECTAEIRANAKRDAIRRLAYVSGDAGVRAAALRGETGIIMEWIDNARRVMAGGDHLALTRAEKNERYREAAMNGNVHSPTAIRIPAEVEWRESVGGFASLGSADHADIADRLNQQAEKLEAEAAVLQVLAQKDNRRGKFAAKRLDELIKLGNDLDKDRAKHEKLAE